MFSYLPPETSVFPNILICFISIIIFQIRHFFLTVCIIHLGTQIWPNEVVWQPRGQIQFAISPCILGKWNVGHQIIKPGGHYIFKSSSWQPVLKFQHQQFFFISQETWNIFKCIPEVSYYGVCNDLIGFQYKLNVYSPQNMYVETQSPLSQCLDVGSLGGDEV